MRQDLNPAGDRRQSVERAIATVEWPLVYDLIYAVHSWFWGSGLHRQYRQTINRILDRYGILDR